MRLFAVILTVAWALTAAVAQPPALQPVREGNIERLVLDDGLDTDAATWSPAEAVVTVDNKHARRGDTSLRFHIDVNWETGQKDYPVGWPRMYRWWPEGAQDWSTYDYLDFSIYTEASRPTLPTNPLGLILKGANRQNIMTRELTELRPGAWTDYRLPLADILGYETMTGVQFYISESNYRHGDVLDFWIDNMSIVRLLEPSASSTVLPEKVIAGDAGYLPLDLHLMGVAPGQTADVIWQIKSGASTVATGKVIGERGKRRAYLALPVTGLKAGDHELSLKTGSENLTFPFRVVASAWQEASK